ncbi:MAG: hypothetical protein IT305_07170 [Chloroflexi bacterium]|nr:hypothetical protein [Chloroflexota bacterium]
MAQQANLRRAAVTSRSGERPARSAPRIGLGARLALVLLGLLAPLVLTEAALRVAGAFMPGDYQTVSFMEAHPEFGRRNRPGAGWKRTSEYKSWIEINSKGLRGPEIDYPKPPGEYRILVVGDSFTFGEQVNQDETFTSLLESRLNAQESGQTYRVLNAGSNGWATANELIYLAKEGVRFQPDVVIVALYLGNDVSDNFRRVSTVLDAEKADLALRGVDSFDGPRRILRHSELYTVFESGVLAKLPWWSSGEQYMSDRKPPKTAEEGQEAWDISEQLLDRARDVSESQGARFVVMVIPSASVVASRAPQAKDDDDAAEEDDPDADSDKPGFEDPHGTLGEIVERNNLTTLDLLSALRRADSRLKERLYYRQNAHWTAAGHAVAAEEIEQFLGERGLLTSH